MSRVGFVVHEGRGAAVAEAERLREALEREGVDVLQLPSAVDDVDLVVAVGGDGTFLRAAHEASAFDCPILGVKVGRLGFLTEVAPAESLVTIREALAGHVVLDERSSVTAEPAGGPDFPAQWGLNEIMVEKGARHRLIHLAVEVDGTYVTTFSADGVIVATPTGSTAYSFSARGPIVAPHVPCLILTPIAPHMVFDRSFVLSADAVVTLEVEGEEPGILSADGRASLEVPVGTRVRIRTSSRPARFVRRGGEGFLSRVRDKFGLPGSPDDVRAGDDARRVADGE